MRDVHTKKRPKVQSSVVKVTERVEENGDFTKKTLDDYKYLNK